MGTHNLGEYSFTNHLTCESINIIGNNPQGNIECENLLVTNSTNLDTLSVTNLSSFGALATFNNGIDSNTIISTQINSVLDLIGQPLNAGLELSSGDVFTNRFQHYHCVLSLNNVLTPTYMGDVFLEVVGATGFVDQYINLMTSYMWGNSIQNVERQYYKFLLGWYKGTSDNWVINFDIYNARNYNKPCTVKAVGNVSYSGYPIPGDFTFSGNYLGSFINTASTWGNGLIDGTPGLVENGPFSGIVLKFPNGWSNQGTVDLSITGFN